MAVTKINKLEIIGLSKDREGILSALQKLGIVELISFKATGPDTGLSPALSGEAGLLEIEEAVSFLSSFKKEKPGLFETIIRIKPLVFRNELKKVISGFEYRLLLEEISALRNQLKVLIADKEKLKQERLLLLPWHNLDMPLDAIHPSKNCGTLLGILNLKDFESLSEDLEKESQEYLLEIINRDQANAYACLIYNNKEFEKLEAVLKKYHFNAVVFPRYPGSVSDRLFDINSRLLVLDDQEQDLKKEISALSSSRFRLMVVYDYLANLQRSQEADRNLAKQKFTFRLCGWIRHGDIRLLEESLSRNFKDLAIFISDPQAEENVPVALQNSPLVEPFEFITSIYGLPGYKELDPTPFLAPFFFIYFGFCVSDVGYGVILSLFSLLALKKFSMGAQGKKFFKLFFLCGISTVIVGALTGSWFGNLLELLAEGNKAFIPLKRFKDSLMALDPMKEPTKLLGIALGFGIFQVFFGHIVAVIGNVKNKRYAGIIFDQLPMLTFLFGLTGLTLVFLKLLTPAHSELFGYASMLGAAVLLFTQGRSEKGLGAKLFYGGYNLYIALSGYLSDVLSYSRLWALGLVTGVMATTINLISVQFSQILVSLIPFINKIGVLKLIISSIILAVIFIIGHLVSFLMNLLGAFVHPLRLQFVEFFSKFFKGGGKGFKPFRQETRYVNFG